MPRRIYAASSWRNPLQPAVVNALRAAGHEVHDFRHPPCGCHGFAWSEIDPHWQQWSNLSYVAALDHPTAVHGYESDYGGMQWADTGVLVLPSGRSSHLEAGYFNGAGKDLFILLTERQEPELMYRMATKVCLDVHELLEAVGTHYVAAV